MLTAILPSGKIISAIEYDEQKHGYELYCIDVNCKAPVVFVGRNERTKAYFKTVGRDKGTKHTTNCGFYQPLDVAGAVEKIGEYQSAVLEAEGVPKKIIRLSLSRLDPEYESVERAPRETKEKPDTENLGLKDKRETPDVIGSLTSIVKLLTSVEPDVLASIYFSVAGRKIPMSMVVMGPQKAHETVWADEALRINYFVYGRVIAVRQLEKVTYLELEGKEAPVTLVIFKDYYKHFDDDKFNLYMNKKVLVYGQLRKNDYGGKKKTEIIIKTSEYITILKKKEIENVEQ
ncbi:hypothetical protein B1A99_25055 [Cohnella sp. CIP 111063]|uniref:hypothetical protein n=1 Tax=unclassified Cohnella TaxID=2636738 RepID=UPI000B8BEEF1|nr:MULTISPECIES: hypothetical protein [unclassified Cohnella]OXS55051.1 hypothetical protein B1A99_25055 [Cohnella sp. CIP 111063]PRX65184.1 hypothetical protein B0G52_118137 [Cohnella sp. SGD-V74]